MLSALRFCFKTKMTLLSQFLLGGSVGGTWYQKDRRDFLKIDASKVWKSKGWDHEKKKNVRT